MLCAGFSLRPFVACFLLKSEMLERDHYFSYLAWPLPPLESFSPCTGSVLTQCCVEMKFKRKLEFLGKKACYLEWDMPQNRQSESLQHVLSLSGGGVRYQVSIMHHLCLRWFWNSNVRANTSMRCKLPHGSLLLPFVQQVRYPDAVSHKQRGYLWLQSWLPSKLLNARGSRRRMCSCRLCGFFILFYSEDWRLSV